MGDLIRRREAVLLIISCVVAEPNSRPPPRFELLNVPRMEEHHRTPVATQEPVPYYIQTQDILSLVANSEVQQRERTFRRRRAFYA